MEEVLQPSWGGNHATPCRAQGPRRLPTHTNISRAEQLVRPRLRSPGHVSPLPGVKLGNSQHGPLTCRSTGNMVMGHPRRNSPQPSLSPWAGKPQVPSVSGQDSCVWYVQMRTEA